MSGGICGRVVGLLAAATLAPLLFFGNIVVADSGPGRGFNRDADTEMTHSAIAIHDADDRHYEIDGILLVADVPGVKADLAYVFGASCFNAVIRRNESRLGFVKDIPAIGKLFSNRIRAGDITPGNRVGTAYLFDRVILIDVRSQRSGASETLASPSASEILQALDKTRSRRGQISELSAGNGEGPLAIGAVSILNRDYSQTIEARNFVAQAGDNGLFGDAVGGSDSGKGPALSKVPVLGPWFVPVGDVHRQGNALLVVIRPSILVH